MRLIQKYLPNPRHTEVYRIFVLSDPETAWNAVRHLDMGQVPLVRLLFDIRTLPNRLSGKLKEDDRRIGVDQITDKGKGFFIAEEIPGKEVVVASAGKFWHVNIPFADVSPSQFKNFNVPDHGKLAWSISVEPYCDSSTIAIELRTTATDEKSWMKLSYYYGIIGIGSRLIRNSVMHHLEALLGKFKRPDDDERILPGDGRLSHCKYQLTHTTDIEAPLSTVWSYLMQLGCDRAGWYSIDALDHGGKPSIDHLVQGWETRKNGDKLWATPDDNEGFFEVYEVEHEKHFIIGGEGFRLGGYFKMTWAFITESIGEDATRLTTRVRMEAEPRLSEWLMGAIVAPPIHAIMQKTQLKHLKNICEREAQVRKFDHVYEWT
jgi:hypothetical protein